MDFVLMHHDGMYISKVMDRQLVSSADMKDFGYLGLFSLGDGYIHVRWLY